MCDNTDERGGHDAKRKKPVTEGQTRHNSTYTRDLTWSNSQQQRAEWVRPGPRGGASQQLLSGRKGSLCRTDRFRRAATQRCTCNQRRAIAHLKFC